MYGEKMQHYNEEIEILREKMIQTAIVLGLNHPDVLAYSQKLDEKHNMILKLKYREASV
ncbi:aspartyl-phosphate phosphatase Spo0E family protein [Bacillus sp. RAR_GA_16]|uniref:aspartyl-phosphate phosphatase Spo0E family protein n=1 Tax=Bacillus sp. RAR_GA_16 TaxID=2876774 RepID=UPI001CCD7E12|nr:aspartyl-phosphate phosphatase Spo0E family protein [Bacillus sp. RAR_GA_16]MCA0171299.1 aspartyl-phosphate phosphatase Spo0E family protein [Bacillus sp. RAR_GA_16]